ncbi:uncharacterized protein LAESUDRAFT_34637 [Laetiporus sulphureus 93-53]|uniref:Uncharacterized protein n=1 Tax=Laetiporus sulphureus 93-53 TaxID=1314785 RepID=A0A165IKH3_9APHY|nr:uncharacterized protein LAESUDRAFT_34637 [Laetiporus sulphureus 93-53]KZT13204.1 hypothetical protein LAESUDRAFT_34637 [Laetiporus sulphureus 93-53]
MIASPISTSSSPPDSDPESDDSSSSALLPLPFFCEAVLAGEVLTGTAFLGASSSSSELSSSLSLPLFSALAGDPFAPPIFAMTEATFLGAFSSSELSLSLDEDEPFLAAAFTCASFGFSSSSESEPNSDDDEPATPFAVAATVCFWGLAGAAVFFGFSSSDSSSEDSSLESAALS